MKSNWLNLLVAMSFSLFSTILYAQPTHCTNPSRECVIEASTAYLNGLVAHDPSDIPLSEEAQRWENGVLTASNADALRNSIKNDYGIKSVKDIRDLRWFVEGNQAVAFFLMDSVIPGTQKYVATTRIAEIFQVENGMIKQVENIFCASPHAQEQTKIPPPTSLSFICNRL